MIIDHVWNRYGALSGARLSALTHQSGTPWSAIYNGKRSKVIGNDLIREHYKKLAGRV
ncbi:hypothetical protein [Novosphingobium sp. 17-62-19]|uniref:hypothetical protein n=1 Tax=Novosphingobium sp. 17-62-19 TaxID=1970406 RepID=UPI00344FF1E1